MKIGVFDSGIGGLTVLRELCKRFPKNSYTYFGDTANVPYGTKSVSQIQELSKLAAHRMKGENLDFIVVGCNTASSLALSHMQEILFPVRVMGVVEAGVISVSERLRDFPAGIPALILGTRATIRSKIYSEKLALRSPLHPVYEQACPLLVPMIEEGWRTHPILLETIREYTKEYVSHDSNSAGVALLACTHYPFIRDAFKEVLPQWTIIDSATAIADVVVAEFPLVSWSEGPSEKINVHLVFSDPEAVNPAALSFLETEPLQFKVDRAVW